MDNTKRHRIWIKGTFYFSGLFLLTLGIAFTIASNLGASPFDALLVGLYNKFGLTVGSWEYILGAILVVINALVERRRPGILAILTAFITGVGIDFWLGVLSLTPFPNILWLNILILLLGVIFIGLGIATYLQADFAPSPIDGTMLMIKKILGVSLFLAKNILMLIFLVFAIIFEGPIAYGTIVMVIITGPSISFFFPVMEGLKKRKLAALKAVEC